MDDIDRAQEHEQKDRALAIAAARSLPFRDFAAEICTGCDCMTKTNYGKSCEAWADCLQDLQRRERNA